MNNRTKFLLAPLLAILAPAAFAQTTTPVLTASIVLVEVSDGQLVVNADVTAGGSNYALAPTVTLTGGGNPFDPGFVASVPALVGINGGSVTSLTVTPGADYIGAPTVAFSGGSAPSPAAPASGAAALLSLNYPIQYILPSSGTNPNEASGAAGRTITVAALAEGTQPQAGFVYTFLVNGQSIGVTTPAVPAGTPAGGPWTPPLPGVYYISATTSDGNGNTATTLPVRYFATGTAFTGPTQGGSLVPLGSSLVLSATSTPADGFVQRIDFYTDWTGSTATSTLIGSSFTYPYSIIYTPGGVSGTSHTIKAIGYDNNGNAVPEPLSYLDSEVLDMVTSIGPLPTCVITTPSNQASIPIPDYAADPTASIPISVTAKARPQGTIQQVQLYIDGVLFGTSNKFPYTFNWSPTVVGLYNLTALAYDDKNNVVASSNSVGPTQTPAPTVVSIGALPSVDITSPSGGGTLTGGGTAVIQASASANSFNPQTSASSVIQSVQFFQDGNFVGQATSPTTPGGNVYSVSFKAVQKIDPATGSPEPSILTAIATDSLGFTSTSPGVVVNVTSGGSGGGVIVGIPPTISVTAPANNANVVVNTPVTLSANANAPNGNVAQIDFLVDGSVFKTITQYPYSVIWTPGNLGFYTVNAVVTDNLGDKINSATITVNVVVEPPPLVSVLSPSTGGTVTVGSAVNVTASASSPSGTVASVQFFANGLPIGMTSTSPYTISWTPTSAGVYTITAITTDNAGETTTSSPDIVEALNASSGVGTTSYFGQYQGLTDGGRFAFISIDGTLGTYIGHSGPGSKASITFASGIPVGANGSFSANVLTGEASINGTSGTLVPSGDIFIGAATLSEGVAVAAGYYTGNLSGQAASSITAILGQDGELMAYITAPSYTDVADGAVDPTGAFTITTVNGNTFTGKINPSTGLMTGGLSGSTGGTLLAARVSGGTFSDGELKNISTRAVVGTGADQMISGFVVGGSASKQLLIRAAGPGLAAFGLPGALAATQLQVYSGSTLVASNTGWSSTMLSATAVSAADAQVGAFAFANGSGDSALVGTFAPGAYTAEVTGVGGTSGTALAEVYDMDGYQPFSSMKLVNVSTRGNAGNGAAQLIGGFSFNGTAPKRLLIRAAGPALSALGVANNLAAAHLRLFDNSENLLRENFSWQTGNDAALVRAAELQTGAFAFQNATADSVILINLPPGTYTAAVSPAGSASAGIALIEIYEVP